MNVIECIKTRKSVRGYKPDQIPKKILKEILEIAVHAPSAINTQPWEFMVITGDVLDNIRRANAEKVLSSAGNVPTLNRALYKNVYKQRQIELAKEIFRLMGIAREDLRKRNEWMQKGCRFFDAPAAIIISMDKEVEATWALFDLGVVSQTICLAALEYGLATCIESQGVMYEEVIRKYTGLPETKEIIISIAIGYPDWDFPANKIKTGRVPVDENTTWYGFES